MDPKDIIQQLDQEELDAFCSCLEEATQQEAQVFNIIRQEKEIEANER